MAGADVQVDFAGEDGHQPGQLRYRHQLVALLLQRRDDTFDRLHRTRAVSRAVMEQDDRAGVGPVHYPLVEDLAAGPAPIGRVN